MQLSKKSVESEIFTGSMADVSFLLSIFFMLTSAFSANHAIFFTMSWAMCVGSLPNRFSALSDITTAYIADLKT